MRTKLVFPPRTGPTYMPLGIASLQAVANKNDIEIGVFDANVELWNEICDNYGNLNSMRNFCHAPLDMFLRQKEYEAHISHMPEGKSFIDRLEREAVAYLEKNELGPELNQLLARQAIIICFGNPESVAFSAMYPDQFAFVLASAKYLDQSYGYDLDIIIGGAATSAVSPEEMLEAFPFVDAIMTGEGEIAFELFLKRTAFADIPGCFYRIDNRIETSGRPQFIKSIQDIACPDFSSLHSYEYFNPVPVMPILGGRGCKWRRCSFCSHNSSFGTHRNRYAMAVLQEMIDLREKFGCRHFYFADQYVTPDFLEELSDLILASGFICYFHVMARTIGEYTPQLLEKASRAGCCWISWGMESGSQRLLDIMNKGTDVATSARVIKDAAAVGISNLLMMIFGSPGSNRDSLDETFSFISDIYEHIDSMTASAFVLFDNTAFSRNPAKYGLKILDQSVIFNVDGKVVHGAKLRFKREGEYGEVESPLAAREIDMWERRKVWLGPQSFIGKLCCEHYLLFAEAIKSGSRNRPNTFKRGA